VARDTENQNDDYEDICLSPLAFVVCLLLAFAGGFIVAHLV
jgi:hypothetical protein